MASYRHHVSGFFTHRLDAEKVVSQMIAKGFPPERVHLFNKYSVLPVHDANNNDDNVLKDMIVDGAVGSVVGTGLGVLIEVGLIAANVTLFVASPLIAPLTLMGWGASLGGIVGATIGAAEKPKALSDLVHDAILTGQIVVVVETLSPEETSIAGSIIQEVIGNYSEASNSHPA